MIGIYKITNLINNKVYIGQSKNIEYRWKQHKNHPFNINNKDYDKRLYQAIRKYGLENFSFEILEECQIQELNNKEIYWIKYYDSANIDKGYNMTLGGQNSTPIKLTYEQVDKIINLLKNSQISQQEIANQFNISQSVVSEINNGKLWIKDEIQYPIRKYQMNIEPRKNYCKKCGAIIYKKSKYCVNCNNYLLRRIERPTREILKQQIRNLSFLEIGRIYKVSDNAIRKWCDYYNLPRKKKDISNYSDEEWELV